MDPNENTGETQPKKEATDVINLVVKDQAGGEVHFKVKLHTKLEKVIQAYCSKKSIDVPSVRFLYDGARVLPADTPGSLEMGDGDIIEVVQEQVGGAARC